MLSHSYEICQAANLIYETFREMSGRGETVHLAVQRMKDINWSQGLPLSPGKRQIILDSLAFFCIAQIWRATCFTSFDLKRSDVGHKKGSHGIWKRTFCQTCKNERREEINLDDTFNFLLLHIFTHKPACTSPILFWKGDDIYISHYLSSRFSSFRFQFFILKSTTWPCDHLWSDHPRWILTLWLVVFTTVDSCKKPLILDWEKKIWLKVG